MNINTDFLIIAYLVSMFVDWIFQTQWQARNKYWVSSQTPAEKKRSLYALVSHAMTYALLTTYILYIFNAIRGAIILDIFLVLAVSHAIIDSRIIVKEIMMIKGFTEKELSDPQYVFMHIGIDHRLHEFVLVMLALFVK